MSENMKIIMPDLLGVRPFNKKKFMSGLKSGLYRVSELGIEQRCSICLEYWPLDSEFYCVNTSTATGLRLDCKACEAEARRKRTSRRKKRPMKRVHMQHAGV